MKQYLTYIYRGEAVFPNKLLPCQSCVQVFMIFCALCYSSLLLNLLVFFLFWSPINFPSPAISPGLSPVQINEQDKPLDKYLSFHFPDILSWYLGLMLCNLHPGKLSRDLSGGTVSE